MWRQEFRLGGPWFNGEVESSSQGPLSGLDFIPSATPDELRRLWADSVVRGGALRNQINAAYYVVELVRIRNQIETILDRLPAGTDAATRGPRADTSPLGYAIRLLSASSRSARADGDRFNHA